MAESFDQTAITMDQLHLPQPWRQVYFGNNISNWGVKVLNLWKIINRKWKLLSCVQIFVNPWIVASQVPLSMEFSRQEYWSGLSFPSTEDLPNQRIKPGCLALQADSLPSEPLGKPQLTGRQRGNVFIDRTQLSRRLYISGKCFIILNLEWITYRFYRLFKITFYSFLERIHHLLIHALVTHLTRLS